MLVVQASDLLGDADTTKIIEDELAHRVIATIGDNGAYEKNLKDRLDALSMDEAPSRLLSRLAVTTSGAFKTCDSATLRLVSPNLLHHVLPRVYAPNADLRIGRHRVVGLPAHDLVSQLDLLADQSFTRNIFEVTIVGLQLSDAAERAALMRFLKQHQHFRKLTMESPVLDDSRDLATVVLLLPGLKMLVLNEWHPVTTDVSQKFQPCFKELTSWSLEPLDAGARFRAFGSGLSYFATPPA